MNYLGIKEARKELFELNSIMFSENFIHQTKEKEKRCLKTVGDR